jgi:hypothetical protein
MDSLASGRLTAWLLAILALVLSVYLFLPQEGEVGTEALRRWVEQGGLTGQLCRALGLNDVLRSWLFWGPYALLLANLVLCMIRRLRATHTLCRFPEEPPRAASSWLTRVVEARGIGTERVGEMLRRKGYRTLVAGETVYGLRGRFAIVGHWLFHLGLLALLLAGSFVAAAPDPFRGTVGVGEGEPFDLHGTPFLRTTRPPTPDLPGLRFRMERIDVQTEGSAVRRFDAQLSTPEGGRATVGINRPYRKTPYQVLVHGFGYMAGWVIVDPQGRMLRGAWVKLVPFPLERPDSFPLGPRWSRTSGRARKIEAAVESFETRGSRRASYGAAKRSTRVCSSPSRECSSKTARTSSFFPRSAATACSTSSRNGGTRPSSRASES